ncbi:hypothetical protein D3C83_260200 [compost metagenome]
MLGFGALRAMNDAIKSNRDLLKAGKKNAFEKDKSRKIKGEQLVLREKKATPEVLLMY